MGYIKECQAFFLIFLYFFSKKRETGELPLPLLPSLEETGKPNGRLYPTRQQWACQDLILRRTAAYSRGFTASSTPISSSMIGQISSGFLPSISLAKSVSP